MDKPSFTWTGLMSIWARSLSLVPSAKSVGSLHTQVPVGAGFDEVPDEGVAVRPPCRVPFGVELDAEERELPVPHRRYRACRAPGEKEEIAGDGLDEFVVRFVDRYSLRQAREERV